MKYQYKIIGLVGKMFAQKLFYKFETDYPYTFNVGDEVWFPENWKKEQGGGTIWKVKEVQHYVVENFVAVYVFNEMA